jgi:hypothetical protein
MRTPLRFISESPVLSAGNAIRCSTRLVFTLLLLVIFSKVGFPQDFTWITPNKTYLKLSIADDGMHRISRTDFTNAGITTANIDPRTVKIYNKGTEIPIFFQGESDGIFDAADYLDFYATRNYGGMTKYYTVDNTVFYQKDEFYNLYSDTNVYWIGWDGNTGLRYNQTDYSALDPYGLQTFSERIHIEKDKVYSQGENASSTDYRFFNNEMFQGEGWYWIRMYNGYYLTDSFSTPSLPVTPENCTLNFFAYPADVNYSVFNEHRITIFVNSNVVADVYKNDLTRFNETVTFSSSLLTSGAMNRVNVYYQVPSYDGHTNFDYIDIKCPRTFKLINGQLLADLGGADTTSKRFTVTGYTVASPLFIYDVKNNQKITSFTFSSDTLFFTAKGNAKLEIYNKTISKKPFKTIQRQVPDLVSSANGADYVIVYNTLFESQAQQLADYRASHDGFRVMKVKTSDIYDIFNYGIESPLAVKQFGKNAYNNWTIPKFKYLCLFGRGTFDPKKNSTATVYNKNLVPVYGYPTSDSYFANYNMGAFTYLDQVAVGRLPVYTTAEAQAAVDNIIMYESKSPESWMKNILFVVGGGTADDQSFNQSLILPFISNYVNPPPVSGNSHKAFRIDNTTTVTYNYKDSVRRDINNGDLIVNFQGHAGYENWEDAMQEPSTLSNPGKLPLVWSMTCYTGKTADNTKRSFGEKFVTMSNKGAIGFLGSTGWGFVYSGNSFQDKLYKAFARDTLRRTGDIIKYGKSQIAYDSVGSVTRHTINCYGLMGDPAVKLTLPVKPEFNFNSNGYRLSDEFPTLNQTVTVTAFPFNYGLHSDSCKIAFSLKIDNSTIQSYDTIIRSFKYSDSVRFSFRLDSIQNYSVHVELDKDNWVPTEDKTNNTLDIDIPMKNNSFVQLRPVDFEVIGSDSIEFTGLNPITDQSNVKVILQMDTSLTFQSPLMMTFMNDNISGNITKFKTVFPVLSADLIYYWRTNAVIAGDSTGWTNARSFSYFSNTAQRQNLSKSVSDNIAEDNLVNVTVRKSKLAQFPPEDLFNTVYLSRGIDLIELPLNLYVRSMGSSGAEISNFSVNDKAINYDGGRSPGLNMIKVRRVNGQIIEMKNFRLLSQSSIDSVVNFLNTFDSTYYLMALNASYVDYVAVQQLTETAKQKIRSFGSTKIDSMYKFGFFDTWSFIGYLGASQANVSEQFFKYTGSAGWREAQSSLTRTYWKTSGSVRNIIGPSANWQSFSWQNYLLPNSTILFDVIGIDNNGSQTVILSNVATNEFTDLSSINAGQYPYLDLSAKITIDTMSGNRSSELNYVQAGYTLPAEIVLDGSSLVLSDSALNAGEELKINFTCSNSGYSDVFGLLVNSYKTSISPSNLISSDTANVFIPVDSSAKVTAKFKLPYYRTKGDGKLPLIIEVIPVAGQSEFYTYNNSYKFSITQKAVGTSPIVQIFSDDKLITGGEQVRSKPEIRIEFNRPAQSEISRSMTSDVVFKINGQLISPNVSETNVSNRDKMVSKESRIYGSSSDFVSFRPELSKGTNRLSVLFRNEINEIDSVSYDVIVSDIMSVTDLYNYPNPMKDRTSFVFSITGSEPPDEMTLGIYTIAGRKIREIKYSAVIGSNQIDWDGRDNDGDAVANGTYIYKLIIKGSGQTQSIVQKLAVLR